MSTNAPTSRARPTRCWIESKGAPSVLALPRIIMAHSFSLVKEMYRDMFAAAPRIQVSSQRSSTTEIPGKWWRAAPETDSWD